jgi:hypothetical protein
MELILQIIADETISQYRDEGGIASSERDLRYALELLVQVRNWINALDIEDAVEQERAFYAAQDQERAGTNEPPPAADLADWPALHGRWSELSDGINELEMEVHDNTLKPSAARKRAAQREYDRLKKERDQLLDAIYNRPIDNFEAIATLIDIAIENGEIDVPLDLTDWVNFNKVLKALRERAPAIKFTAVRRAKPKSIDVEAIIAKA